MSTHKGTSGKGQSAQSQRIDGMALRDDAPMMMDDLDKQAAYYKDSVAILGMNMNELEGFINPS